MRVSMDTTYRTVLCACVCVMYVCTTQAGPSRSNRSRFQRQAGSGGLGHRLRKLESEILRKVEQRYGNHHVREVERRVGVLTNELSLLQKHNAHKSKIIATLKGQLSDHEARIQRLTEAVAALQRSIKTITSRVKHLEARGLPVSPEGQKRPGPTRRPDRPQSDYPRDCEEFSQQGGMKKPGVYETLIQPLLSDQPFTASCKRTNSTGWTVLQRRQDGSVDFFRTWTAYKTGFGNLDGEFWLGLDYIYQLTNQDDYKLRIEMTDFDGNSYWAEYEHFRIENEAKKYRLHVHDYHGNAGDSMTSRWEDHNNQPFSTHDRDNDDRFYDNCAKHYKGAWWFKSCFESHLNGIYYQHGSHNNYFVRNGIQWNTIHVHSSLKYVTMMIAPNRDIQETVGP